MILISWKHLVLKPFHSCSFPRSLSLRSSPSRSLSSMSLRHYYRFRVHSLPWWPKASHWVSSSLHWASCKKLQIRQEKKMCSKNLDFSTLPFAPSAPHQRWDREGNGSWFMHVWVDRQGGGRLVNVCLDRLRQRLTQLPKKRLVAGTHKNHP